MFNGSNCRLSPGAQLCVLACKLVAGERPALMESLVGEIGKSSERS